MNFLAFSVALLVAAPPAELRSGLQRGEEVAAWNPIHVAGPDKGTRACPVCTYLERPVVIVFTRDGDNAAALAEQLEKLVAANEGKDLKGFVIVLDATPDRLAKMAAEKRIAKIGLCYLDPRTKDKDLELYKIHPQARNTILVYRDYKVTANFVNLDARQFNAVELAARSSADRAPAVRKPANTGSQPATAPPPSATKVAAGIRLAPQNTRIEFVGSSERTSHAGSFQQFTGTFEAKGDDLRTARLTFDIDMDSTATNIGLLTRHLKSKDYFDVRQYPHSTFVSTSIQPSTTPQATHIITGNLTLHGVTRTISAPANITLANGVLTLSSRFVIRQSEFGMTEALKKTKDEVPITVTIRAAGS
ncbi:MAG TPA: YceI family protein [Gemmataceae bacterium]|jgi:polyisoprenoid-binding protein YceI